MSEKKVVKKEIITITSPQGIASDYIFTQYSDGFKLDPYIKVTSNIPKDLFDMKTPTKKKAVKKTKNSKSAPVQFTQDTKDVAIQNPPYELFQSKDKTWKWRKRAKNRAILNHSYNTKAAAIKGMKADYSVTVAMAEFGFKEVKG